MAEVLPFVATRFGADANTRLAQLLTPPYDVIDAKMKQAFYDADPHNIVRIDFGKDLPGDSDYENRYSRASAMWQQWKQEGVLTEESRKAFYVYEQEFDAPGHGTVRRRGFFGAVKLQDYAEGGIRAHEHTFDGPKADRFRLMRATNCNMSSIFCIYDDPTKQIDALLKEGTGDQKPDAEATIDGVTHRLWVVAKPAVVQEIARLMEPQTLYIADGHHRYETSLLYRDEMRSALRRTSGNQPFDYALIYMNNMHDDGLIILPTHRILTKEACHGADEEETLTDLQEHFDMETLTIDGKKIEAEAERLTEMLAKAGQSTLAFIMLLPKGQAVLLRLKAEVDVNELIDNDEIARPIKELDVTVLHQHIINRVWLGNPDIELDDQDVHYEKDAAKAMQAMQGGKFGVAFLLNPTKIEQVCHIAQEGLRMPHKSTYFYPKLVTGLVMRDMNSPW